MHSYLVYLRIAKNIGFGLVFYCNKEIDQTDRFGGPHLGAFRQISAILTQTGIIVYLLWPPLHSSFHPD